MDERRSRKAVYLVLVVTLMLIHEIMGKVVFFDESRKDNDLIVIVKERMDRCNGVDSVNLGGSGLTRIANNFVQSDSIRSISLENNFLDLLPRNVFKGTPNLVCLNLARNRLPIDHLLSFDHIHLKTLIYDHQFTLGKNRPTEAEEIEDFTDTLPVIVTPTGQSIPQFPSLEYLDISGNEFQDLPNNFNAIFPKLTHLYLTDRYIGDIWPEAFTKLPASLTHLHLEKNIIRELQFPYLGNIQALFLDQNPLLSNASHVLHSHLLKELSLSNCTLKYVNSVLFKNVSNLVSLDLSHNQIGHLSGEPFAYLYYLQELSLSDNRLTEVPYSIAFNNLNKLSLSYNYIKEIPYSLPWSSLRTLSLRGNGLVRIDPTAFVKLYNLENLDLAENYLKTLPAGWMKPLTVLRLLNLKFNEFTGISDMSIDINSNLEDIYIRSRIITSIDEYALQFIPQKCAVHVI